MLLTLLLKYNLKYSFQIIINDDFSINCVITTKYFILYILIDTHNIFVTQLFFHCKYVLSIFC